MTPLTTTLLSLLPFLLTPVHGFDPTPLPTPLTANSTHTLPALACTVFTYTLPANTSLSLSVAISPPLLALGYTTATDAVCSDPDTAAEGSGYGLLLDTTTAPVRAVYSLANVTRERCWTRDVTLRVFAATAFAGAYEKEGSEDIKTLTVGAIQTAPTGNRTCTVVPAAAGSTPGGTAPTSAGAGAAAPGTTPTWSLLPPPPGTQVLGSSGAVGSVKRVVGRWMAAVGAAVGGLAFL
ncbi:hypothetical protein PhCBS80983_g05030 [Powellomyces hirtus]|uniref:Uncharacterized protein n=1 Tax=Powellomyces hirtus TaxID=109895 RepID=A0A507DWC1_9FUNG|nr:hypothetical protein PhCBS80983_g05030 [Powellomyces hirtus]